MRAGAGIEAEADGRNPFGQGDVAVRRTGTDEDLQVRVVTPDRFLGGPHHFLPALFGEETHGFAGAAAQFVHLDAHIGLVVRQKDVAEALVHVLHIAQGIGPVFAEHGGLGGNGVDGQAAFDGAHVVSGDAVVRNLDMVDVRDDGGQLGDGVFIAEAAEGVAPGGADVTRNRLEPTAWSVMPFILPSKL